MKYFDLRQIFTLIVAIYLIYSCGGGGADTDLMPQISNTPPFFVNNIDEVEVDEMQLSVATISANDNDDDVLQYSLSGNDPSYFSITNQGVITFNQPPSYFDKNEFSILINVTDNIVSISQPLRVFLLRVCSDNLLGKTVCFEEENLSVEYDRSNDYPTWQDWDGDCQNNRHEVLQSEHIDNDSNHPLVLSADGCFVNTGKWYDPYDDRFYFSSSEVQIDHVVALFEAHKSGAWSFPASRKVKFANNIDYEDLLIAVGGSSNASKGSSDPSQWMPENKSYKCDYLKKWLAIKSEFRLSIDSQERDAISEIYQENNCIN
jgi:hypothetical protein